MQRRTVLTGIGIVAGGVAVRFGTGPLVSLAENKLTDHLNPRYQSNSQTVGEYIETSHADTITEAEEFFSVSLRPIKVTYIPTWEQAPGISPERARSFAHSAAQYFPQRNEIMMTAQTARPYLERPDSFPEVVYFKLTDSSTKGLLLHELGGRYVVRVHQQMTSFMHPGYQQDPSDPQPMSGLFREIIAEGTSEYFGIEMGEKQRSPTHLEEGWMGLRRYLVRLTSRLGQWPTKLEDFQYETPGSAWYSYGYDLVRPIFDEFGVQDGLERILLQEPISEAELFEPKRFHERVLS